MVLTAFERFLGNSTNTIAVGVSPTTRPGQEVKPVTGVPLTAWGGSDQHVAILDTYQWRVQLENSNGLHLRQTRKSSAVAIVTRVEGALAEFNARNPDRAVRVGDAVFQVNSVRGKDSADKMLEEVAASGPLDIAVERPVTTLPQVVMLEKGSSERTFGMQVIRVQRDGEDYTHLEVTNVEPYGAANRSMQLSAGDIIVEVNSISGDGDAMVEQLKASDRVSLYVERSLLQRA